MNALLLDQFALDTRVEMIQQGMTDFQWIQVFPWKTVFMQKYKRSVDFTDNTLLSNMLKAYESGKIFRMFLDKDHDFKANYGEFGKLEIRNGEGTFIQIKLNKYGVELIKSGLYRYISPVIDEIVDTDGQKWENVLLGISFTNVPVLLADNPTIQEQLRLSRVEQEKQAEAQQKKGEKKRMQKLCMMLSLNPEANEDAIVQAVEKERLELANTKKAAADLKLANDDLAKKIADLTKQLADAVAELTGMKDNQDNAEAQGVVEMAIKSGKVEPRFKDKWVKRYKEDKEGTKLELSAMKAIVEPGQKSMSSENVNYENSSGLSVELSAYMDEMGWDKKDKDSVAIAMDCLADKKRKEKK